MSQYEYAAVPAPKQVPKVKGLKGAEQRFAHGMTELLNTWAAEGWEFVRAETMGFEEKSGFIGKGSSGQTQLMIFRREMPAEAVDTAYYAEAAAPPEELARELPPVAAPEAPSPGAAIRPTLSAKRETVTPARPLTAPAADPAERRKG